MTGVSLLILAGLQIWDVALTTRILRAGGREMNGLMAAVIAVAGTGWGAVKYGAGMAAAIWAAATGHGWMIWVFIAVMAAVVDHNLTEWHKMRGRR